MNAASRAATLAACLALQCFFTFGFKIGSGKGIINFKPVGRLFIP
jgi:hypothetical protein